PPGGGCRGRARCAGPSARRGHAASRRARGTGRAWPARRPPTTASDRGARWARRTGARSGAGRSRDRLPPGLLLGGVGGCRLAHPGTLLVGGAPVRDALGVARPVALEHPPELVPVDRAEVPVP